MGLLVLRVAGAPTEHHQQTQGPCQHSFQTGNDILVFSVNWQFTENTSRVRVQSQNYSTLTKSGFLNNYTGLVQTL